MQASDIHVSIVVLGAAAALLVLRYGPAFLLRVAATYLAALADAVDLVSVRAAEYRRQAGIAHVAEDPQRAEAAQ